MQAESKRVDSRVIREREGIAFIQGRTREDADPEDHAEVRLSFHSPLNLM